MNKPTNKDFKALKWVRGIRDKDFNKYKNMSGKEYIELMNKKAKNFLNKKKSKNLT